jgi:hypothetical protein
LNLIAAVGACKIAWCPQQQQQVQKQHGADQHSEWCSFSPLVTYQIKASVRFVHRYAGQQRNRLRSIVFSLVLIVWRCVRNSRSQVMRVFSYLHLLSANGVSQLVSASSHLECLQHGTQHDGSAAVHRSLVES